MTPYKRNPENPNCPFTVRFACKGRNYVWSTKTTDLALAKKRAKEYRDAVVGEQFNLVSSMKAVSNAPSFEQLFKTYDGLPTPDPLTRKRNIASMRAILKANRMTDRSRLDELGKQVALKYQQHCLATRPGSSSAVVSANSGLRRAKSLFSRRALDSYDGVLMMPMEAVRAFMSVGFLKEYAPEKELPSEAALAAAVEAIKDKPYHRIVWCLARYGGLRASEIVAARRDWLQGNTLLIGQNPDQYKTKGRKARRVALPAEVVEVLNQSEDPVFLAGPDRHVIVGREMAAILRQAGITADKPLHSLRRLYGSIVFSTQGPAAAQDQLGHSSILVTQKHYAHLLTPPAPVAFAG